MIPSRTTRTTSHRNQPAQPRLHPWGDHELDESNLRESPEFAMCQGQQDGKCQSFCFHSLLIHEIQQNPWEQLWHYGVRFVFLPWSLVPYGAPISPSVDRTCWPCRDRSTCPRGSPAPSPYHPERRIHRHLGESWVKSYDFAYDWDQHPLIDDLVPSYPSLDYFTSNYCLYHHLPIILMWNTGDLEVQTMCTFTIFYPSMGLKCRDKPNHKPTNVKVHQPNHKIWLWLKLWLKLFLVPKISPTLVIDWVFKKK